VAEKSERKALIRILDHVRERNVSEMWNLPRIVGVLPGMHRTLRPSFVFLCALLSISVLAGCASTPPQPEQPPRKTALLKMGYWENDSAGSEHAKRVSEAIKAAFQARSTFPIFGENDSLPIVRSKSGEERSERSARGGGGPEGPGGGPSGGGFGGPPPGGREHRGDRGAAEGVRAEPTHAQRPATMLVVGQILQWTALAANGPSSGPSALRIRMRLVNQSTGRAEWSDTLACAELGAMRQNLSETGCLSEVGDSAVARVSRAFEAPARREEAR